MVFCFRLIACLTLLFAASSHATIVRFETSLGDFDVNLYDNGTPLTVANFLEYVNNGDYDGTFIHRSDPGFVLQGGGFSFEGTDGSTSEFDPIIQRSPITNEPEFSNVLGTIAMAKGSHPDSATSQWFFNLANNSASLDDSENNGGFTAFGEVMGNGMSTINAIAALNIFNYTGVMQELPLRNFSIADYNAGTPPTENNIIEVISVSVIDANLDTAADLNPTPNTFVNSGGDDDNGGDSGGESDNGGSSGGGSTSLVFVMFIALPYLRRRYLK